MPFNSTLPLRFWSKVYADDYGCWLWMAVCSPGGYGRYWLHGTTWAQAHRESYRDFVGPIPEGLTIDHLCRVRVCVNPRHLEAVTLRENIMRGTGASAGNPSKTSCPRGHLYSGRNLKMHNGWRYCRTCVNKLTRESRAAAKGQE